MRQEKQYQEQLEAARKQYEKQSMAINNAMTTISPGDWYGYGGTTGTNTGTYTPAGSAVWSGSPYQVPWSSTEEGEWTATDTQDAAGYGWLLAASGEATPMLKAWSWSPKAEMTDEELIHDVIQHAMTNTPIAYKMLCILTKNRSPYSKWADTAKALAETYAS